MQGVMFSICLLWAAAAAALAWSFRDGFCRRLERDAAWLDEVRLMFGPDVTGSRRYVQIAYFVQCAVLLPLLAFLIPVPVLGVVVWMCLWMLPQKIADMKWRSRLKKIDEQLPQTIRKFASLCAAGLSPASALQQLAKEAPVPIRHECLIMSREWDLGANLESIVSLAAKRLGLESFRLFAAVVAVNTRLGGNLVATLEELAESLSSQLEMRREVDSAMAEGRMNVFGLLLAPPIMLGIVTIIDRRAVGLFFSTPTGLGIFALAMVFVLGGTLWARRIANMDI